MPQRLWCLTEVCLTCCVYICSRTVSSAVSPKTTSTYSRTALRSMSRTNTTSPTICQPLCYFFFLLNKNKSVTLYLTSAFTPTGRVGLTIVPVVPCEINCHFLPRCFERLNVQRRLKRNVTMTTKKVVNFFGRKSHYQRKSWLRV